MEFRSTDEFAPVPPGTKRRPLTSTSVRVEPSPRRLMRVDPSPPLLTWVLVALDCTVRVWSTSPMEASPFSWISVLARMTTGAVDSAASPPDAGTGHGHLFSDEIDAFQFLVLLGHGVGRNQGEKPYGQPG